jgi:hypothetical protein
MWEREREPIIKRGFKGMIFVGSEEPAEENGFCGRL